MSAGRDKNAKTRDRKHQRSRAKAKRLGIHDAQKARRRARKLKEKL